MTELPPEIAAYYEGGREAGRLTDGRLAAGPLEFERTVELIGRVSHTLLWMFSMWAVAPDAMPPGLQPQGDRVLLVDPIPLHVHQAAESSLRAEIGDARDLHHPDETYDVLLLMGPLYHLVHPAGRAGPLAEARRVLRPGGLPVASAISRFAALLDLLVRLDRLHEPGVFARIEEAVRAGDFRGHNEGFTTAFLHLPSQLRDEITAAGRPRSAASKVPRALVGNFDERLADSARREAMLRAARLVEAEPELLDAANHLLAFAHALSTER